MESALTNNYVDFGKIFKNLFIFILVLACIVIVFALSIHAIEKHKAEAEIVEECLDTRGPIAIWTRSSDNRKAIICEVFPGKFGVKIDEQSGKNVTAFIKNKLNRLEQIFKYLENTGYAPE